MNGVERRPATCRRTLADVAVCRSMITSMSRPTEGTPIPRMAFQSAFLSRTSIYLLVYRSPWFLSTRSNAAFRSTNATQKRRTACNVDIKHNYAILHNDVRDS